MLSKIKNEDVQKGVKTFISPMLSKMDIYDLSRKRKYCHTECLDITDCAETVNITALNVSMILTICFLKLCEYVLLQICSSRIIESLDHYHWCTYLALMHHWLLNAETYIFMRAFCYGKGPLFHSLECFYHKCNGACRQGAHFTTMIQR